MEGPSPTPGCRWGGGRGTEVPRRGTSVHCRRRTTRSGPRPDTRSSPWRGWGGSSSSTLYEVARSQVPSSQWLQVRYEDVVAEPRKHIAGILDFSGLTWTDEFERAFAAYPFEASQDRWLPPRPRSRQCRSARAEPGADAALLRLRRARARSGACTQLTGAQRLQTGAVRRPQSRPY